jgi:2-dehydro-3-deoxyphosphooctonate aldolase (KDO 8-P synthase)
MSTCRVGSVRIGPSEPLAIIAGPCVLEDPGQALEIGKQVRDACRRLGLSYIFKASFDKANRSSISSPRGPGLERGLKWIADIRESLGVPATTDIHEPAQAEPAAGAVDLLQIPAFLCRQTDLLLAAGQAAAGKDRGVNVKKGQFMSPAEMAGAVRKLSEAGCTNVMLTERGTFFGYNRLVNDFIGIQDLMNTATPPTRHGSPPPVCFDATHSVQLPGGEGEKTGGRPEAAPGLARAAVALGVHAVFLECHPEPKTALSDGSTMLRLEHVPALLAQLAAIRGALAPLMAGGGGAGGSAAGGGGSR